MDGWMEPGPVDAKRAVEREHIKGIGRPHRARLFYLAAGLEAQWQKADVVSWGTLEMFQETETLEASGDCVGPSSRGSLVCIENLDKT